MKQQIIVTRLHCEDAAALAARIAKQCGTKLSGSMRWRGNIGPTYRDIDTADGREICIAEPDGSNPFGLSSYTVSTDSECAEVRAFSFDDAARQYNAEYVTAQELIRFCETAGGWCQIENTVTGERIGCR